MNSCSMAAWCGVRTPKGEASVWRQYHGIRVNGDGIGMAWYKDPAALLAWVTTLPLVPMIYSPRGWSLWHLVVV